MTIKKNYIMVGTSAGFHRNCNSAQNQAIELLYTLFTDQGVDVQWLLRVLLDSESSGIGGELADISIREQQVVVRPSSLIEDAYPEDYALIMKRRELLILAHEWQELIKKGVAPIFIYYKDGKYGVADILPEGVE